MHSLAGHVESKYITKAKLTAPQEGFWVAREKQCRSDEGKN